LNNYSLNNEGYSWYQDVVQTIIPYNPSHENVVITGNIDCGQVVVDTVCPEPSSIVLLGIGAISLLAYAWRRRRQTV
jgi:threonine dehydrogenase-like Zn-dependent dehydrogenase